MKAKKSTPAPKPAADKPIEKAAPAPAAKSNVIPLVEPKEAPKAKAPAKKPKPAATEPALKLKPAPTPTVEEVAKRAYYKFLAEGGQHGRHVEHWLEAEQSA